MHEIGTSAYENGYCMWPLGVGIDGHLLDLTELTINIENGMGYVESHVTNTEIWHCNAAGCYAPFEEAAA